MGKLSALLDVFRTGKEVANVESWKRGTINVNLVTAALAAILALAKAFGLSFDLSYEQIGLVATVLVAVVALANSLLTAATSARAGLPGLKSEQQIVAERMVAQSSSLSTAGPKGPDPGDNHSVQDRAEVSNGDRRDDRSDDPANPFRDHGA